MSARTPFVPGTGNKRPASRAHIKEQLQQENLLNNEDSATRLQSEPETLTANLNATAPKYPFHPLNTASFQKKNNYTAENRPALSSSLTRSVSRPSDQSDNTFTSSFRSANFPMNPALKTSSDIQLSDLLPLNPNAFKLNRSHSNSPHVSADPDAPDHKTVSQAAVLPRLKRSLADTEVEGPEAPFEGGQQKRYKVNTEDRKLSQTVGSLPFLHRP